MALFFLSLLFFYDLLGGRFLLTERDLGPYFIPPRFFWVESIKRGDFPLWNPYQFCGHPFFANPQHAVLYPLNSLFFILPFDVAFNTIILLHFFLGGLFTYLFVRDLKVHPHGALISGLIFMLSGYLLSVHSLLTILLSSVWTPLILMFFRRAILYPGIRNEMLTAVFITFSFLGGGIEIVYGNFFVLLLMVIFHSPLVSQSDTHKEEVQSPKGILGQIQKLFGIGLFHKCLSLLVVSIIFLFLSAIQLFPFFELYHHSIRGSGISYQEATLWSFAPKDIVLFFLPDAYGYFLDAKKYWVNQCWFKTLYTGGLPFILSAVFFKIGKRRAFFLSLIFFSLFFSLGSFNPLYPLIFKYIPFVNGIRYPVKFLYLFILILSVTAGLGFQRLVELSKEGGSKPYKNLFFFVSIGCGIFLLFLVLGHNEIENFLKGRGMDYPQFNRLSINLFHIKRGVFYLALFFLLIRIGMEVRWRSWTNILLIFFLTADLFGNMGFYGKEGTSDYFKKTRIIEHITSDQGKFRIFSTAKTISADTPILIARASPFEAFKEKHLPSMTLLYRIHHIWGLEVLRTKRTDDLYKALTGIPFPSSSHLLDLYGIKYIISVTPLDEDPRFELIDARIEDLQGKREDLLKENTIKLYQHRCPFPRAWLVREVKVLNAKEILSTIIQKGFDPGREALLEEPLPSYNPSSEKGSKGEEEVKMISETNNRLILLVKTGQDNLLIVSDTYYPGWKAMVNGVPQKIYRANYSFRAIPLKAGYHHVEFVYTPFSFKVGGLFTFLGIIGCVSVTLISDPKRPPRINGS